MLVDLQKGIELLDNPDGFFMMVEGGKIDWACHANDAAASIEDTIAFDNAIGAALEFYKNHMDETVIIVTGDHETGGLTIGYAGTGYETFFDKIKNQDVSYDIFTAMVNEFRKNNSKPSLKEFFPMIEKHFGLKMPGTESTEGVVLSQYDYEKLSEAFKYSMIDPSARKFDEQGMLLYGGYDPLTVTVTHILNQKAGIAWTSYSHTGVPVPTFAIGVGNESFNGYYDNTDVFKKMAAIMGIKY